MSGALLAGADGSLDVGSSEFVFGSELVVGSAEHAQVFGFGGSCLRAGAAVVDLEPRAGGAAVAVSIAPSARDAVAFEDGSAGSAGNVGGGGFRRRGGVGRHGSLRLAWLGSCGCGFVARAGAEAAFQLVGDEQLQRAGDHGAEVAAGIRVAQQVAALLELVFDGSADRARHGF